MTPPRGLSERIAAAEAAEAAAAEAAAAGKPASADSADGGSTELGSRAASYRRSGLGFRTRLTLGLVAAAVLPLAGFGVVVLVATADTDPDSTVARVLLLAIAVAVAVAVLLAAAIAADLSAPLRAIATSVDRVSAGDLTTPLELPGDDEVSRLAESHNRLARDLGRRNLELRRILTALEAVTLDEHPDVLAARAATEARAAFGMIDCAILLVDPATIEEEELVPGDPVPVRAQLSASGEVLGVAVGHLPATRRWERADQDLLELFAIEIAAAIRNAQLYARVDDQNRRLIELDEAKDDFLRGVSHNLQTPLASIRGYAQQLEGEQLRPAPRDHHRAGRPPFADGPPAADSQPDRIGRAAPGPGGVRAGGTGQAHVGGAGCGRRPVHPRGPVLRAGSRSPTLTSSTRSCGRSSTTP